MCIRFLKDFENPIVGHCYTISSNTRLMITMRKNKHERCNDFLIT